MRVGAALAVDVDRPLALTLREVGDRHAVEHHRVPLDRHVVEAVGPRLLELDAQALAQVGVAEPRDDRLRPAGVHPTWQQRVQVRGTREIGIRVERDVDSVVTRPVDQREQLARAPAIAGEAEMRVREVQRHAGAARDLDRVGVALDRVQAVIAVVRAVVGAAAQLPAQLDQLVVRRVHARRVGEAGRQADRALGETLTHERAHRIELVRRGGTVVRPHGQQAQRGVGEQVADVDRGRPVEAREIVRHAPPAVVELGLGAVPARQLRT